MKISITAVCLLFAALTLTSCATQNLFEQTAHNEPDKRFIDSVFNNDTDYQYVLKKDDKVNVSVWDNDDLSVGSIYGIYNSNEVYGKWLMIDANGNVNIPKLGEVNLAGLTLIDARSKLQGLFRKWIVNPIVDVKVLNKEITILGELKTPGRYLLEKDRNTLVEAIGKAGDFDFYANKKKIQVIRMVRNQPVSITVDLTKAESYLAANILLKPGDVIYVPSRKGKVWDKRAGSTIVPIATAISSAVLIGSL